MILNDIKEIEKFFKLCRKQGVTDISMEGFSVKFGELPSKLSNQTDEIDEVTMDSLTPEQLMFLAVDNQHI